MNLKDQNQNKFALVREMFEAREVAERFDSRVVEKIVGSVKKTGRLLFTGEGSSRIFPAKNAIRKACEWGAGTKIITDGARQAAGYDLSGFTVVCASNSGKTREVIALAQKLNDSGNRSVFGVTATKDSLLERKAGETIMLSCGLENAVAATKSVFETGLVFQSIVAELSGRDCRGDLETLGPKIKETLSIRIPKEIIERAVRAPIIYFAGYNDGVAEELTLKTNEIVRRRSDFLEGTYPVHGIEEVMDPADIVFVIDPIEEETGKLREVLEKGVGCSVVAIANRKTDFQTIVTGDAGEMTSFLYLCAGWNLLVSIGLYLDIDLDKPVRARKVGNECIQ